MRRTSNVPAWHSVPNIERNGLSRESTPAKERGQASGVHASRLKWQGCSNERTHGTGARAQGPGGTTTQRRRRHLPSFHMSESPPSLASHVPQAAAPKPPTPSPSLPTLPTPTLHLIHAHPARHKLDSIMHYVTTTLHYLSDLVIRQRSTHGPSVRPCIHPCIHPPSLHHCIFSSISGGLSL